jgi:hypothetical protein
MRNAVFAAPPDLPNSSDSAQTEVSGVTSRALSLGQAIP